MDKRHLTPVQLLAWIDGRLVDVAAARHASRCPICKARREAIERRSPVGEDARDPGRHVDGERLVAYADAGAD